MIRQRCASYVFLAGLTVVVSTTRITLAQKGDDKKASLSLKATPPVGFSPLKVRLTADVRGGADDNQDFYCPSIEWDWGDDLTSESSEDCAPYEAGKSEIKRRFVVDHKFESSGSFKVYVRLKHGSKELVATSTTVKIQPGGRIDEQ